jgi:hypothetical protein
MVDGTLNMYYTSIGAGDIDLSTAACELNAYNSRITTDPINTSGAFAHYIVLEHCDLGLRDIISEATAGTQVHLRHCSNVGAVWNQGTGNFVIQDSYVSSVKTTSTGKIYLYGGYLNTCTSTVGDIVWWTTYAEIRVIENMSIQQAINAGAADTVIRIAPGAYAESNITGADMALIGDDPRFCIISKSDASHPIFVLTGGATFQNLTIRNNSASMPAIKYTAYSGIDVFKNCIISGTGAGDAIQLTDAYLEFHNCKITGDIALSGAASWVEFHNCQIDGDISTAAEDEGHGIVLMGCDLHDSDITSLATGGTDIWIYNCVNVGTVTENGTGDIFEWIDDTPVDGEVHAPISSNWAFDHNARDATAEQQGHATAAQITKLDGIEAGADVTADHDPKAHAASHAVGGADTVFPADPGADKVLKWKDDPGELEWADPAAGAGDMTKAVYDTNEDDIVDKAALVDDGAHSASAEDLEAAVSKKHDRQHTITSTDDHTSGATEGQLLQADGNGLPVDASITDAEAAAMLAAAHTQGTDQKLDDGGANEVSAIDLAAALTKLAGIEEGADVTADHLEEISTVASSATPTPTGGSLRNFFTVTALAETATFAAPSGTPANANRLVIRIKDNGTARALAWNAIYRKMEYDLPTTTVINKTMYLGFIYNSADSKWDMVAINEE